MENSVHQNFLEEPQQTTTTETERNTEQITETSSTDDVINKARKLISEEKINSLTNEDLEAIRERSLLKFVRKFNREYCLQRPRTLHRMRTATHWNDSFHSELFPNPRSLSFLPSLETIDESKELTDLVPSDFSSEEIEQLHFDSDPIDNVDGNIPESMRYYFSKWYRITCESRTRRKSNRKIEKFIENVEKYQMNSAIRSFVYKTVPEQTTTSKLKMSFNANRLKAQKMIIEQQKQKLLEQSRIIDDLKMNKTEMDINEALEIAEKHIKLLKSQQQRKKQIKNNETDVTSKQSTLFIEQLKIKKIPKLIIEIEQRAKAREERRLLIKERKRLIDEQKKRQIDELLKRKHQEKLEEKRKRMEDKESEEEFAKQAAARRKEAKRRFKELNRRAESHYKRRILRIFGLNRFRMFLLNNRLNMEVGRRFYENNLILRKLRQWFGSVRNVKLEQNKKARAHFQFKIKTKSWKIWKRFRHECVQNNQVAIDYYDMSLQERFWYAWLRSVRKNKEQTETGMEKANENYKKTIMFKYFDYWRSFPAVMKLKREQEKRKRKWRIRVSEILPDYKPIKNYDDSFN